MIKQWKHQEILISIMLLNQSIALLLALLSSENKLPLNGFSPNFEGMLSLQKYNYLNYLRFILIIRVHFLGPHLYTKFLGFYIWKNNFLWKELRAILRKRLSFMVYNPCQFSRAKWKGTLKVELLLEIFAFLTHGFQLKNQLALNKI